MYTYFKQNIHNGVFYLFQGIDYATDLKVKYEQLTSQLDALLTGEKNMYANLSNASALLNQFFDRINWVGFYLMDEGELVLGPFQGLPACIRIPLGKGVCGTAAKTESSIVVPDVNAFPGHIACDAASLSEVVIPILKDGTLLGVLDVDSPELNRFTNEDRAGLELFVEVLVKHL